MKATKKLILAAVSLVAAASLTVGSTFAWFSYQSSVELGKVEFSVDSGDENLQVAVVAYDATNPVTPDESDFSYSLSAELIKSKINGGTEVKYKPLTVSGADASNTVAATDSIALVNEDKSNALPGSYAVFDLVFRYTPVKADGETAMPSLVLNSDSDISAKNIPADDESGVTIASSTSAWTDFDETDYGIALNEGDPINARARDAARVAFLYDDKGTTKNKVWAPSEVFDNDINTYTSDRARGFYRNNLASDYKVQRKDSVTNSASPAPTYSSRIYKSLENPTSVNDFLYSKIAEFPKLSGTSTSSQLRVTVKVWLEGTDGDCLESFQNDAFAFTLKFRTSTIKNAS
ncbi:MAG: hypothetical protein K2L02_04815 [Clostridia bacterium]|nr:hypothetical protein [Clostridia bacterium]